LCMVNSEFELIEATARGDPQAFETLVKRYQNPLCNFIFRYLGDRYAAEDIAQEVFLRVYKAAPKFDPRGRVSSWIFKIAYNLSVNELKKRSIRNRISQYAKDQSLMSHQDSIDAAPRFELEQEMMGAIGKLPDEQRAALLLRVNEDLSYREISEVMGLSVQSVESLLFRARKGLKEMLKRK
jgi:RNA polymerase sigma-70 factor (ECF subfamily)